MVRCLLMDVIENTVCVLKNKTRIYEIEVGRNCGIDGEFGRRDMGGSVRCLTTISKLVLCG